MKTKTEAKRTWYSTNTSAGQGLIIDEQTGRTVAVSYRTDDAPLLAADPEMLEAPYEVQDRINEACDDETINHHPSIGAALVAIRAAIAKAEGK